MNISHILVKHTVGLPRRQLRSLESRVSKFTARTGRRSELNHFFPPKQSDVIATVTIRPVFVKKYYSKPEAYHLYPEVKVIDEYLKLVGENSLTTNCKYQ
jgi:hypothetical protein